MIEKIIIYVLKLFWWKMIIIYIYIYIYIYYNIKLENKFYRYMSNLDVFKDIKEMMIYV